MEEPLYIVRLEVRGLIRAMWTADTIAFYLPEPMSPERVGIHRAKPSRDRRSAPTEVMRWLGDRLKGEKRVAATTLRAEGEAAGYSRHQLDRAKRRLGVVVLREGFGPGGGWFWELPDGLDLAPEDGDATIKRR